MIQLRLHRALSRSSRGRQGFVQGGKPRPNPPVLDISVGQQLGKAGATSLRCLNGAGESVRGAE